MAHTNKVVIHVVECTNLIAADLNGKSDPYVVLSVLGKKKQQTKVVDANLNPKFDEKFEFLDFDYKNTQTLDIEVYDKDKIKKDDLIGTCKIDLNKLQNDKPETMDIKLEGVKHGQIKLIITVSGKDETKKPETQAAPSKAVQSAPQASSQPVVSPTLQPAAAPVSQHSTQPPAAVRTPAQEVKEVANSLQNTHIHHKSEKRIAHHTAKGAAKKQADHVVETANLAPHAKIAAKIIEECKKNKTKYEDKEFPATDKSIYEAGKGEHSGEIKWLRPSEQNGVTDPRLFVDGSEPGDVIQGALGDCYFLGALSVVATRKDLIDPLFVACYPEYGFYQIQFYKNTHWQVVTIDDRIPCYDGAPIYSCCKDLNEIWVPLIEKAYAKIHRNYENLEGGQIAAALTDLTGGSTQTMTFTDKAIVDSIANGSFWKDLMYFHEENYLMGCSFNNPEEEAEEDSKGNGILVNHAYGLLNVVEPKSLKNNMISIRNPWGRTEWKGRFSDTSDAWTPALKTELKLKVEDDGTFWMCMEDWISNYTQMIVCRLLTDDYGKKWQKNIFESEWKGQTAGGSTTHFTWRYNPQIGLKVTTPTKVFINLGQPDQRMIARSEYKIPIGMNILKTNDYKHPKVALMENSEVVARCNFSPSRDVALATTLPVGEYVILPATYTPGLETPFFLTFYSEEPVLIGEVAKEIESVKKGEWKGDTAGGCTNHTTWNKNPKYIIKPSEQPTEPVHVAYIMRQAERNPLYNINFWSGKWTGQAVDHSVCKGSPPKPYVNAREIAFEVTVKPDEWPQYIIPHTFNNGQEGSFEIFVRTSFKVDFENMKA